MIALFVLLPQPSMVPIALIALMERDREWTKSCYGLEFREVPRDASFAVTLYSSVNLSWSAMPSWMSGLRTTPMRHGFPGRALLCWSSR